MKILPDYLIEIMPAVEQAIEELRLSVLDHAYDLLKCLDIDELTSDDIRDKLELYNIKVENMTEDWLPNGRFYRIYPLIKHNRTRLNGLSSVVKSGGQFEGLWSDKFSKSSIYNYKNIQMLRHYDISSNSDGYFYISGDVSQTNYGQVIDSAIKALSSDILLSQSMPAGYTYLYVPWPRPHYPSDSSYFYNVHMLQYSRLHYALDCDNKNLDTDSNSTYKPASEKYFTKHYNYKNKFTIAPYWFDYHYIDENIFNKREDNWPIEDEFEAVKSGNIILKNEADEVITVKTTDSDDIVNNAINDAVSYFVNNDIDGNPYKIISNSKSTFPTACYIYTTNNTTVPNRLQTFNKYNNTYTLYLTNIGTNQRLKIVKILINKFKYDLSYANKLVSNANLPIILLNNTTNYDFAVSLKNEIEAVNGSALIYENNNIDERYLLNIVSYNNYTALKNYLATNFNVNNSYIDTIINKQSVKLPESLTYGTYNYTEALQVQSELQNIGVVTDVIKANVYTIDENYPEKSNEPGPYRWDILNDKILSIREELNHIKTYKPFWNVSSPIFANVQSNNIDKNHSLYYWFKVKQDNNIIAISDNTIQYNKPDVSDITHTSYDMPSIGILDTTYFGYTNANDIGQNKTLSNSTINNICNENGEYLIYDPTLYYNVVGLGKYNNNNQELIESNLNLYLIGDPSTNILYINLNNEENDTCNYVKFTTSKIHKLLLSNNDNNVILSANSVNSLYRNSNKQLYCYRDNTKSFEYTIVGIYDKYNNLVNNTSDLVCSIFTCNNKYCNYIINNSTYDIEASYILFTVKVFDKVKETVDINVTNTVTNENKIAKYLIEDKIISIDDGETFITLSEFYENNWEFAVSA